MSEVPDRIGPYHVLREIGRGGMGVVYLARDERLDRHVAIKALPAHLVDDPVRLARFEREAKALAQLNHPNVAGIYGVEEQDGRRFLVLEYVDGDTLGDRLDGGPIAVDDALELAIEIAAGMEAAHDAGVIHRDLKPDNIKITAGGRVKVLDFGLAKSGDSVSSSAMDAGEITTPLSPTIPGVVMGTAAYMSPEQARGRRVDKRTDIWAFGVVLYEMLVGASPFAGESAYDSIGAVLHKDVDLERLPAETPLVVRALLKRCLTRDRNHRLHDMADARVEIEEAISDPTAMSGMLTGAVPPARRARGPLTLVLGVLLAIALLGAGLVAGWFARPAAAAPAAVRVSLILPWERSRIADFTCSPDGTMLAFAVIDPEVSPPKWSIYLRRLDQEEFSAIHTTERRPHALAFSPDGADLILGTSGEGGRRFLVRLAIDGGRPVPLLEMEPVTGMPPESGYTWISNQEFLVVGDGNDSLQAVSAQDGAARRVLTLPADLETAFVHPSMVVPGGRYVLLTRIGLREGRFSYEIHVADLRTGEVPVLMENAGYPRYYEPGILVFYRQGGVFATRFDPRTCKAAGRVVQVQDDLAWYALSDGGLLTFFRSRPTDRSIATIDRTGSIEPLVDVRREFRGALALSADGTQLAVTFTDGTNASTIAVIDVATGFTRRIDTGFFKIVGWLFDGRLAYIRPQADSDSFSGQVDLMTWDPNATTPATRYRADLRSNADEYTFSPDGKTLMLRPINDDGNGDLHVLDLTDPDAEPQPYLATPADEDYPALSPDGRWLAYNSDTSGQFQVYVTRFVPGERPRPVPVSITTGYGPFWSRDSSELFYFTADENEDLMAASLDPSDDGRFKPAVKVLDNGQFDDSYLASMPDGERFVFFDAPDKRPEDDHLFMVLNWADEVRRRLAE